MAEATLQLKSWSIGETVTGSKLNSNLGDQLNTLFNRNLSIVHRDAVEGYQASLAAGANTFTSFERPIKLVNTLPHDGVAKIGLWLNWQVDRYVGVSTWTFGFLDIKVDDDWYVSSRTATPLSDGLIVHALNIRSRQYTHFCNWFVPNMEAGLHSYELVQKVSDVEFGILINEVEISVEPYGKSLSEQTIYGEPL